MDVVAIAQATKLLLAGSVPVHGVGRVAAQHSIAHAPPPPLQLAVDPLAGPHAQPRYLPAVETDLAAVGGEVKRANLHANGRLVLLLELARQMALNEGGLASAAVANEHQLERCRQ
eukprot:358229-Chlamydomonas_euryale.AAC.15